MFYYAFFFYYHTYLIPSISPWNALFFKNMEEKSAIGFVLNEVDVFC